MRDYGRNTGLRLPAPHFEKLNEMAQALRVSRNKMVALLIESAEVQTLPSVSVGVRNNRVDAKALSGQNVNTVAA